MHRVALRLDGLRRTMAARCGCRADVVTSSVFCMGKSWGEYRVCLVGCFAMLATNRLYWLSKIRVSLLLVIIGYWERCPIVNRSSTFTADTKKMLWWGICPSVLCRPHGFCPWALQYAVQKKQALWALAQSFALMCIHSSLIVWSEIFASCLVVLVLILYRFASSFLCCRSLVAFRFYAARTSLIVNICFYVTSPFMGYLRARKDGLVSKSFHLRFVWFFSMQSGNLQIANRNLCLGSTLYYI